MQYDFIWSCLLATKSEQINKQTDRQTDKQFRESNSTKVENSNMPLKDVFRDDR